MEKECVMRENYEEKIDRKLQMLFEKMLDIEEMMMYERTVKEEEEIKKQQNELECHKRDLEYRRNNIYEHNKRNREAFRRGYWD